MNKMKKGAPATTAIAARDDGLGTVPDRTISHITTAMSGAGTMNTTTKTARMRWFLVM